MAGGILRLMKAVGDSQMWLILVGALEGTLAVGVVVGHTHQSIVRKTT